MGDNASCPAFATAKILVAKALELAGKNDPAPECMANGAIAAVMAFAVMHAEPGMVEEVRADLHKRIDAYFDDAIKEIAAFNARHPQFSTPLH